MKLIIVFLLLAQTQLLWGRAFESIKIPGAKCGDGGDYKVFLSKMNEEKLIVEFMGGGACWDKASCFYLPRTWVYNVPNVELFSTLTSSNPEINPFSTHTMLYFPYCTGDVHMGDHIADYNGAKVYHYGRRNFLLAIKYLEEQKIVRFKNFKDVTVWGASAGAIASLIHAKTIGDRLSPGTKKTLIADSPGLHWGHAFWDKFPSAIIQDFNKAFESVGLEADFHDGFIAKKMRPALDNYRDWSVGFLFATKDIIMSDLFGNISPSNQEKLILGPEGMPAIASDYPNIKVWLKDTYMHTFLLLKESSLMMSDSSKSRLNTNNQDETAIDFIKGVYAEPTR